MSVDQPIGTAVLYVLSTVEPEAFPSFSEWCDTIHHFDTMRVDGFLSMRRFVLLDGSSADGVADFDLLTLYQVEQSEHADFSTPSYARHSASYTPPPPGVVDHITFERTVYERADVPDSTTQPVGGACVALVGEEGPWLSAAADASAVLPGFLNAYRVSNTERSLLLVDVENDEAGRAVLAATAAIDHHGARQSVRLFTQVFPATGVLLRDRAFLPADSARERDSG